MFSSNCLLCSKVFLESGFMAPLFYMTFHKIFKMCLSLFRTAKVASGQQKHLLFEVQPGSDASAFWKVVVRVICTKVRVTETSRAGFKLVGG